MKKVLKLIGALVLAIAFYLIGVLVWGTLTDFTPEPSIALEPIGVAEGKLDSSITLMTWNIGFCGLGEESDFFYDGGEMVIPPTEWSEKNLQGVIQRILQQTGVDVFLLQEVDLNSKRSQYMNQFEKIEESLPGFEGAFANNYVVDFVPVPYLKPLGKVNSGIATYSNFPCTDYRRIGFDTQFSWPTRIFFLDRCFLSQNYELADGRSLWIINTHNSAYDTTGKMKEAELNAILSFGKSEVEKGNLVVVGGDWNECPPGYLPIEPDGLYNEHMLSNSVLPEGWQWVADVNTPTNRKLTTPYQQGESYTSVIDFFLISPGLEVEGVKTIDLDFAYSDHQPVITTLKIKR